MSASRHLSSPNRAMRSAWGFALLLKRTEMPLASRNTACGPQRSGCSRIGGLTEKRLGLTLPSIGDRIRGTFGDIDPLNKVPA